MNLTDTSASAKPLTQVEQYNQHKGLDVAKVTSVSNSQDPEKFDGLVKTQLTYVDSTGATHNFEYTTTGLRSSKRLIDSGATMLNVKNKTPHAMRRFLF